MRRVELESPAVTYQDNSLLSPSDAHLIYCRQRRDVVTKSNLLVYVIDVEKEVTNFGVGNTPDILNIQIKKKRIA